MAIENIIKSVAVSDGMPSLLGDLIVSQSKHETGNYTSDAFTELNNTNGYAYVEGSTWQLPDPGFIADNGLALGRYASIQDSVHELTHWIKRRQADGRFPDDLNEIQTAEDYATLLKNAGYYGDSVTNYTNGLIRYFKANIATVSISGLFLVGLLILVAMTWKRPR